MLMMVTVAMTMGVAMIQGHLSDDFDHGRVTLRWQELPRACLPQLMSRRKMMNRKKHCGKNEKQPRVKQHALYLHSDTLEFTAGSISAVQL